MKQFAVISALGSDRVGLADDIAGAILDLGGNVEESRMAVLGGEFAALMLVSGEQTTIRKIVDELPALAKDIGVRVSTTPTDAHHVQRTNRPYMVESFSLDTPGILHSVTSVLRSFDVNIEDLEADTTAAPWTGAPMFRMRARVSVPANVPITRLREELEHVASQEDLDVRIAPVTVGPAE
jgi:glycine cleavage system transcriptional repressor